MGYGPFNDNNGASIYDLGLLAGGVISGHVRAPLTDTNGETIYTASGEAIFAHAVFTEQSHENDSTISTVVASLVREDERRHEEYFSELNTLAADTIRGTIYAPIATIDGISICTREGRPITARSNEHERLELAIASAVAGLSERLDAIERRSAKILANLETAYYTGRPFTPLASATGVPIACANGLTLSAWRDVQMEIDSAISDAVHELSERTEAYERANTSRIDALVVGLMNGSPSALLTNTSGNGIITDSGAPVFAVNNL